MRRIVGINTNAGKGFFFPVIIFVVVAFFSTYAYSGVSTGLKTVDPEIVCMVNDNVMGKPQIPVEVDGKTYYGCCQNCVGTLKADRSVRFAKDPLTGRMVDKAKAVILEGGSGEALYFESTDAAKLYRESQGGR